MKFFEVGLQLAASVNNEIGSNLIIGCGPLLQEVLPPEINVLGSRDKEIACGWKRSVREQVSPEFRCPLRGCPPSALRLGQQHNAALRIVSNTINSGILGAHMCSGAREPLRAILACRL